MAGKKERSGGRRDGAGRKYRRRVLVSGNAETFAFVRSGSDTPMIAGFGGIEVDEQTGIATITFENGDRLILGYVFTAG